MLNLLILRWIVFWGLFCGGCAGLGEGTREHRNGAYPMFPVFPMFPAVN